MYSLSVLKIYKVGIFIKILCSLMGKFCKKCGKVMRRPKLSHCSDECLLANVAKSNSLSKSSKGVEQWGEDADPWI